MLERVTAIAAGMALIAYMAASERAQAQTRAFLPLSWDELAGLAADMSLPHEGAPAGVPADYSWARQPRMGAGNNPGGFTAITGWGQAFQAEGASVAALSILLRDMRVLVCYGPERNWVLLQQSAVEGGQFQPDFQGNYNQPPIGVIRVGDETAVKIADGTVYHFWPQQGRATLPAQDLCGIVVVVKAAVRPDAQNPNPAAAGRSVLLGLGADYWKDNTAEWDNYESNRDAAIGRLKWVGKSWQWYGLTTASPRDLLRLYQFGYATNAPNLK